MRVLSVNIGLPREVEWKGQTVRTGIFKDPVEGRVRVRTLNLEGDRQADLTVHGGWEKAVYAYPSESYELWCRERPELDLPWSKFGENLTLEGLVDEEISVGDRFQIGSAEFIATEPRLPCYRLGINMCRDEFVAEFLERGLLGFYLAVIREGEIGAGDEIVELSRDPNAFKVTEIARLYARDRDDVEGLQRAAALEVVPESWRSYFREQLSRLERRHQRRLLPAPAAPVWDGFRPLVVREKVRESEDVASFYLAAPDDEQVPPYRPGQFLTFRVSVPGHEGPAIRSYSLSDSPKPDAYRVTIKRIAQDVPNQKPGLVSGFFHDRLEPGDVIEAKAPAGVFTVDPRENYRPVVLIGGGIGITPILSMLNAIVESGLRRETWVFYGVRNHHDHLMHEHLERIAALHPYIHLHVCYSRPIRENGTTVGRFHHARRVGVELLKQLLPGSYYDYYLCGPAQMMQSLYNGLLEWGVPEHRLHFEAFGPAAVKSAAPDPDAQPDCGIEVTFARSNTTVMWSRCDSPLLELAEDSGISIPFGCRAGSCGTCVTRIVSGEVSYLHEPGAPLGEGEALTCVALPASPLVLDT
jgi:ferredoxin-NADP reductase/MOSC domain-containing protein YiiM